MQKKTLRPFLSVSIFVVFLTLFIISNLSIVKAQTQTPLQTYKDPQGRFTIQYPSSTWEIAPRESAFPYYGTATAIAFKPTSEGNDPMSHSVFSITPTDAEKSLDKVTLQVKPKSLDQIVSDTINFLKTPSSVLGDMQVEVLKNNQTAIGGFPAREVTYLTHFIGTFDMQAFVVNGDKLYTFVFSTPELQVPQTFPAVQKMLQSVKFGTPAASTTTTP